MKLELVYHTLYIITPEITVCYSRKTIVSFVPQTKDDCLLLHKTHVSSDTKDLVLRSVTQLNICQL